MYLELSKTVKGVSSFVDGILYVLEKSIQDESPLSGEFMIVGQITHKPKPGETSAVKPSNIWIVKPVTDEYKLVEHRGWRKAGSRSITTAELINEEGGITLNGRFKDKINVVDFADKNHGELIPGSCYVRQDDMTMIGLPSLSEIDPAKVYRVTPSKNSGLEKKTTSSAEINFQTPLRIFWNFKSGNNAQYLCKLPRNSNTCYTFYFNHNLTSSNQTTEILLKKQSFDEVKNFANNGGLGQQEPENTLAAFFRKHNQRVKLTISDY